MAPPVRSYAECIAAAAQVYASAIAHQATLTAVQAAREAWRPGGPSVEELADRIRQYRAEAATARGVAA